MLACRRDHRLGDTPLPKIGRMGSRNMESSFGKGPCEFAQARFVAIGQKQGMGLP